MAADRGWRRKSEDPILLPDGRTLVTLRDAATFITALSRKEAALPEWQAAIEALILVAERNGPTRHAGGAAEQRRDLVKIAERPTTAAVVELV